MHVNDKTPDSWSVLSQEVTKKTVEDVQRLAAEAEQTAA